MACGHLASFKMWTYCFTQFYGLVCRWAIIELICTFLEHMWHVATWLVILSSTEEISRPETEPPTLHSVLGTSPLSTCSLRSSRTIINILLKRDEDR